MFLDPSDFEDVPYLIPNQEESRSLQEYIDTKEAYYLKKVLGLSFYNEFIAGLETSGVIEQKWIDLKDGKEYTVGEGDSANEYEYSGIKDLLKPAIYSNWLEDNYRKWSNGGMIVNTAQNNATAVNPIDEIAGNWNEFVRKIGGGCFWQYQENTLYGFLTEETDTYEGWDNSKVTSFRMRNSLDL